MITIATKFWLDDSIVDTFRVITVLIWQFWWLDRLSLMSDVYVWKLRTNSKIIHEDLLFWGRYYPLCSHYRMLLWEDWVSWNAFKQNSKTGDGYRVGYYLFTCVEASSGTCRINAWTLEGEQPSNGWKYKDKIIWQIKHLNSIKEEGGTEIFYRTFTKSFSWQNKSIIVDNSPHMKWGILANTLFLLPLLR